MDEMNYTNNAEQSGMPPAGQQAAQQREERFEAHQDAKMQGPAQGTAPGNMVIDDKAVKKIVGEALNQVDGVLGVGGGITDLLKSSDDVTRGINVEVSDNSDRVRVSTRIVAEFGKNIPNIVNQATQRITEALQQMAGYQVDKVDVEITDTMTRQEYEEKVQKSRRGFN